MSWDWLDASARYYVTWNPCFRNRSQSYYATRPWSRKSIGLFWNRYSLTRVTQRSAKSCNSLPRVASLSRIQDRMFVNSNHRFLLFIVLRSSASYSSWLRGECLQLRPQNRLRDRTSVTPIPKYRFTTVVVLRLFCVAGPISSLSSRI